MTLASSFRYLWLVSSPKVYFRAVFALLAAAGCAIEFVNAGSSDFAVASILLVQLFAVSTGFTRFASRGYYDPILVSGTGRLKVAGAHFLVSSLPGLSAWIAVGLVEAVRAGSLDVLAFRPAAWTSLLLVSTIPWALSLRLPPLSGGAIWLTLSVCFLASGKGIEFFAIVRRSLDSTGPGFLKGLGFGLAFPLLIPSIRLPLSVLLGLVGVSVAALGLGVLFVRQAEFPLAEEGS
jgi:hypothetical protein